MTRRRGGLLSKYEKLTDYLMADGPQTRRVRFDELEEILGFTLPDSARKYPAWWANDPSAGRHSDAWLSAGWKTEELDLGSEAVTFLRDNPTRSVRERVARAAPARKLSASADFDELADVPDGAVNIGIAMQWKQLGQISLDPSGGLVFPMAPVRPGLYRMRLLTSEGARHYIGESVDLRRRFQSYRTPGPTQDTSIRINDILHAHLAAGETVAIDIVMAGVSLKVDRQEVAVDLADKATRRMLEQAAIVAEGAFKIESLNR